MVARGYRPLTDGVAGGGHGPTTAGEPGGAPPLSRGLGRAVGQEEGPGSGRHARPQGDDEDAGAVRRAPDQGGPARRDAEDRRDLRHPAALDLDGEPDNVSSNVERLDLELPSARQGEALAEPEGHDRLEGADRLVARVAEDLLEPSRPQPDSHGLTAAAA